MELWRELKVGDRVRLTEFPPEYLREGCYIHPDMIRLYKKLLSRRRSLRVARIDEYGEPWIDCKFRRRNGDWEWHTLAISHTGIVRVKQRQPKSM